MECLVDKMDGITTTDRKTESEDGPLIPERRTRHRERKIGEALDLVVKWRDLYHGMRDPLTGLFVKKTLGDAAKTVGVPKKSLDDYMLVIKNARKLGFDFQKNRDLRFGELRAFVKNSKGNTALQSETAESDSIFESDDEGEKRVDKCRNTKRICKNY